MVKHGLLTHGVSLQGVEQKTPVVVQMNDDDFPARFLQDVLTQGVASPPPAISSAKEIEFPSSEPLYQPVQRMLNVALMDLACNSVSFPRVDPTRVVSAGIVVRREVRVAAADGGPAYDDPGQLAAWMKDATGKWNWITLTGDAGDLDPDPTLRPQLQSGQAETDLALAAMALSQSYTESTTPAFVAPPATCAALKRTIVYGMIPTASSEVSDTPPRSPAAVNQGDLLSSLPGMLQAKSSTNSPHVPLKGQTIDCRWLNDDFLSVMYPPTGTADKPVPAPEVSDAQNFTLALRMLVNVFGAFDGSTESKAILHALNSRLVKFKSGKTEKMGDFYADAKKKLMPGSQYTKKISDAPTLEMPEQWEWLTAADQAELLAAMQDSIVAKSKTMLAPQGRFMDNTRNYKLRMFARVKGETPNCPTELVWSAYSPEFKIAAWYETGNRAHPPVPLPDLTPAFMAKVKPNCSFQVPGNLMSAMQGTTLSGLMKGAGGGGGMSLGWICGFNIPLITICAFFVLSIFLSLLNIIFFWLPFIKICIPFPMPSPSAPDQGAP